MDIINIGMVLSFLAYLFAGISLLAVFAFVYLKFTPYDEIALIKSGNKAAAISYLGAMLGFILPIASNIVHSMTLVDLLVWSIVASVVQIVLFVVIRMFLVKSVKEDIEGGNIAVAIFLGGTSILIGILNAVSLTP